MIHIIKNAILRHFKCYHCGTEFYASYPEAYKTQTGYGCKCPTCDYATYTHQ